MLLQGVAWGPQYRRGTGASQREGTWATTGHKSRRHHWRCGGPGGTGEASAKPTQHSSSSRAAWPSSRAGGVPRPPLQKGRYRLLQVPGTWSPTLMKWGQRCFLGLWFSIVLPRKHPNNPADSLNPPGSLQDGAGTIFTLFQMMVNVSYFISEDFCLFPYSWLLHIYVLHLPPIFLSVLFLYILPSPSPLFSPSSYSTIPSQLLETPPLPRGFPLLFPNHPLNTCFNKLPMLISLQIILCHFAVEPVSLLKWKFPRAHNK